MLALPLFAAAIGSLPSLQTYHSPQTPKVKFQSLADELDDDVEWDVYGDFTKASSYIRDFEREFADALGLDDAVLMPSGVMAQSIALLIHSNATRTDTFACHPTSHLLLHEQEAYRHLLRMDAVVIHPPAPTQENSLVGPPLLYADVQRVLERHHLNNKNNTSVVGTLMLELPHRELGGTLTPWKDVLAMQDFCRRNNIRFHCDGARLLEAAAGYQDQLAVKNTTRNVLHTLAAPFDSVYVSLYKGLGGMAGAMLLGSNEFCAEARVWLRRCGGNLYTLLPYAIAGRQGFDRCLFFANENNRSSVLSSSSFSIQQQTLVAMVQRLQANPIIHGSVQFQPSTPVTNMVHGYLKYDTHICEQALSKAASPYRALHRLHNVLPDTAAYRLGFRSKFEWTLGEANGKIPLDDVEESWLAFCRALLEDASVEEV